MPDERSQRWRELMVLLAPVHDQARLAARRIARTPSDGDDLFQEAVLRALDKLPSLRDPARFRAWFHRILFSLHRSRHRRLLWRRALSLDTDGAPAVAALADGAAPDDLARREAADRAARALATLAPAQREAIVLFELHGYTIEEVAELQGASVTAVKTRLSRGRERLRCHYLIGDAALADIPVPEEPRDCSQPAT